MISDMLEQSLHLGSGTVDNGNRDLCPLVQIVIISLGYGDSIALMDPLGEPFDHRSLRRQAATRGDMKLEYRDCYNHRHLSGAISRWTSVGTFGNRIGLPARV